MEPEEFQINFILRVDEFISAIISYVFKLEI
jgi:hypothetical protein